MPVTRACLTCHTAIPATHGNSRCPRCHTTREQTRHATYRDPAYQHARTTLANAIAAGTPILCHWCATSPATEPDHLVRISEGGTNTPANLVPACRTCNRARH